jgi:signal transduction histidine kinase
LKDDPENIYHRELHTVLKFSALINSPLEIEGVLDNAMRFSEEFINAEASSIYELDKEKGELFIRVARGEKKDLIQKIRLKVGEGIAGWVVQTGRPMVVQDTKKEKRFSDKFDRMSGFTTRSLLCVPLILRDKSIGAIQVLNKKNQEQFTDADLEILISMSQQIAVAMENAMLYQRLEKRFDLAARELKTVQEELFRTERLAAMGNLVKGIAHEIRNPIMTIGGFALRIKEAIKEPERLEKYADIILSETARLENLVKKVHMFLDIQSASIIPVWIKPVIDELLTKFKPAAEKQGVEMHLYLEEDLPMIDMDARQLLIALSNIVENALEAMHEGGRIEIHVTGSEESGINIVVKDTGSGIAEDELDCIYDPFFTSKTASDGLGLTMVHQIIKNHNGDIEILSKKAEGTTVKILLPLRHERKDSHNPQSSSKKNRAAMDGPMQPAAPL